MTWAGERGAVGGGYGGYYMLSQRQAFSGNRVYAGVETLYAWRKPYDNNASHPHQLSRRNHQIQHVTVCETEDVVLHHTHTHRNPCFRQVKSHLPADSNTIW